MKPNLLTLSLLCLLLLSIVGTAIEVTPDSKCSQLCANTDGVNVSDSASSQTFSWDLQCFDSDFTGNGASGLGRKFRSCVSCEQSSTATSSTLDIPESDTNWFLFNLKATLEWCLFYAFGDEKTPIGFYTKASQQCRQSCQPIADSLNNQIHNRSLDLQYNYCTYSNSAFMQNADLCSQCLNGVDNSKTLVNFIDALKAGCDQKPRAGATVSLKNDVFSIPTPSPTTISKTTTLATTTALATPITTVQASAVQTTPASSPNPTTPIGVIAGIAIGSVACAAAIGFGILYVVLRLRNNNKKDEPKKQPGLEGFEKEQMEQWYAMELPSTRPPVEIDGKTLEAGAVETGDSRTREGWI